MVEGSGFLQWLSVYTFALSPNINILLLDEPDAHLHCALQRSLMNELNQIAKKMDKQILVSTHSSEVIKEFDYNSIMHINGGSLRYLSNNEQKSVVLNDIGTDYFPLLDSIKTNKHILFVENESDARYLQIFCGKYAEWPSNLTIWPTSAHHKERKEFFLQIKDKIPSLKAISLCDRDNLLYNDIDNCLKVKHISDIVDQNGCELRFRTWRRWEMESYLLCVSAMARLRHSKHPEKTVGEWEEKIKEYFRDTNSLIIPGDYKESEKSRTNGWMFDRDAKEIIQPILDRFELDKYKLAEEMNTEELFDDTKIIINEIIDMCNS